jgi:APA family basic amino acid/polyamine antiporter/amino acid efflux transporter
LNETKTDEIPPTRTLKLYQGVLYGIGCGVGGSIFVLLGNGIEIAKSGILISLILGGILIFFTGLNYAELSTSLPIAGGAYNFTKEGLGGFLAFIIGFFLWIANVATCSFSAQTFALVIDEIFKKSSITGLSPFVVPIAIFSIIFTSIVIFRTQRVAIKTLLYLTVFLIIIFIFFIITGLIIPPLNYNPNYDPSFINSGTNFFGIIYSFSILVIFFTSITSNLAYLNPDLKNPSKNIPKANILAILITLFIYLSVSFVVLINIGGNAENLGDRPILLADVLENVFNNVAGFYIMAVAAIISTFIAMNAALGSGVAIITALARDRYVPKKIKELKMKSDLPAIALTLTVVIATIFTIFAGIGLAAETTIFIYFFGLAFVNYAAVILRRKRKALDRPFKAPFFPYLPIFISICFLIFALFLSIEAIQLGFVILIIGVVYYLLTIADRSSIVLTLAGIKFFLLISLGSFIYIINNFSNVSRDLIFINRILIMICIFTIGTIIFDVIPLREMAYYFIRKIDKQKVAIKFGNAQIIELGKRRTKILHFINIMLAISQFISFIVVFIFVFIFYFDIVIIEDITFGMITITQNAAKYFYNSILIFFGIILSFSGIMLWYINRELKSLGI